MQQVRSQLALRFSRAIGAKSTRVDVPCQEPPQRIVRAFPMADGGAMVHLHNLSGGVLGGDALALDVAIEQGAAAQITTTGATRIYRRRPALPSSRLEARFHVESGGLLEYVPDALIPFADAEYWQTTSIDLEEGAGLLYWEIVAPGREARDEIFAYRSLQLDLSIFACGVPIAVERLRLEPGRDTPTSPVRLGPYRYFATFYACRAGAGDTELMALEKSMQQVACALSTTGRIIAGASALAASGVVARLFSMDARSILPALIEFWRCAKRGLFNADAVYPRKLT